MLNASGRFDARRDAPLASRPKAATAAARGGALHGYRCAPRRLSPLLIIL